MKNKLLLILFILLLTACEKPAVDTKKEAANVREIVSKIAGKKINNVPGAMVATVLEKKDVKEAKGKESDFSLLEPSKYVYPYENRKDPFYSLMLEKEKMKEELEKNKRKESEESKKAELGINMSQEEWGKVEIMAILGDGKEYLVLFGGDDTIYQKNDYIDKDKKIQIVGINKNSVNLMMNKNGRILNKQIVMKLEK